PLQPGLGALLHALGLGGSGADHPDLDAGLGCDRGAGGDRGDGERDPAVSDGGVGAAAVEDAENETPPFDPRDAFHRRHAEGRMLSAIAKSAARTADRVHTWARLWASRGLHGRDYAR